MVGPRQSGLGAAAVLGLPWGSVRSCPAALPSPPSPLRVEEVLNCSCQPGPAELPGSLPDPRPPWDRSPLSAGTLRARCAGTSPELLPQAPRQPSSVLGSPQPH